MLNEDDYRRLSIISCPSDIGAGKLGNAYGVKELSEYLSNAKGYSASNFVIAPVVNVIDNNKKSYSNAKYIEQIYFNLTKTYHAIKKELISGNFCLNLLGDHSNAISSVSAFTDFYGVEKSGLIWVDAHSDIHSPYTTPSGNMHGMPLAALIGDDNIESKQNEVGLELNAWWERFKNIGQTNKSGKLLPENLVIIGLRNYEEQEMNYIKNKNIKFYTPQNIASMGIESVMQESKEYLKDCESLCCSFDIDSIDSTYVKATGTPVTNGLTLEQAKYIFDFVLFENGFKAMDVTEFNPLLEQGHSTFDRIVKLFS